MESSNIKIAPNNKLIINRELLVKYIGDNNVKNNIRRGNFQTYESGWFLYESVLAYYAKNAKMLAVLPSVEDLQKVLNDNLKVIETQNLALMTVQSHIQNYQSLQTLETLYQTYKNNYFSNDLAILIAANGKSDAKAAKLAALASIYTLLANIKGKNDVRALNIPKIQTKGVLIEKIFEYGKKVGIIDTNNCQWFMVSANEFRNIYLEKGRDAAVSWLHHGNEGNKNAGKLITCEIAKKLLLSLWANINSDIKYSETQIFRIYERLRSGDLLAVDTETAELLNKPQNEITNLPQSYKTEIEVLPQVSLSSIRAFFKELGNQALYSKYRHGNKYYNDKFRPHVLGKAPKYSFSWCSQDGFVMPFVRNLNGKATWIRYKVVFIFDVMSKAIVGYSRALENEKGKYAENCQTFKGAINNMLITHGIIPMELQQDNAAKYLQKEYLIPIKENSEEVKSLFPFLSFPAPYNAKAKPVEKFMGMFDEEVLRNYSGWFGKNLKAVKNQNSIRNEDFAPDGYTELEFDILLKQWVDEWNTNKGRLAKCLTNVNPQANKISANLLYSFCSQITKRQIKQGYIKLEFEHETYTYEFDNYQEVLSKIKGTAVRVRFIPEHLNTEIAVYKIVDENKPELDVFIDYLPAANLIQRAKAEMTKEDKTRLSEKIAQAKHQDKLVVQAGQDLPKIKLLKNTTSQNSQISQMDIDEAKTILQSPYKSVTKEQIEEAEETFGSDLLY